MNHENVRQRGTLTSAKTETVQSIGAVSDFELWGLKE